MIKVRFLQGVMYEGTFYQKGEVSQLEKQAYYALGDTVEAVGKIKEDDDDAAVKKPVTKNVEAPKVDKMIKAAPKAKDLTQEAASVGGDNQPTTPVSNE